MLFIRHGLANMSSSTEHSMVASVSVAVCF